MLMLHKSFYHVLQVPVIASISGPCIGGAVDLITACDLRYCDTSAAFSIKEVDLAIVADIGTYYLHIYIYINANRSILI